MAFQENTLGDTTVFNSSFDDVDCIIIQIVIDNAFSYSVVFIGIFNDWLLEVSVELKDLLMKLC